MRRKRLHIRNASVIAGLAITLVLALQVLTVDPSAGPAPVPLSVSINLDHPEARVPQRFLGLSFELSSLPRIARCAGSGDFVTMLRSLGGGVLRFGGVSADTRVAWTDAATPRPAWASSTIDPGELRDLRSLAARSGWRILLTIGLTHYDPRAGARVGRGADGSRRVGHSGEWRGPAQLEQRPDRAGVIVIDVSPASATLVTVA
jgi:hypothetical protein